MVKVVGHMFSLGASGTLSKAITFRKGLEGYRVEKKPVPTDRRSAGQLAQREVFRGAAALWSAMSAGEYVACGRALL